MLMSLKKHGVTAVAGALGVWLAAMAVLAAFDHELSPAGRVLWPLAAALAGLLILAGLIGIRRDRPHAREVLAGGVIFGGMMSMWAIVPALAAVAIVFWLYRPRRMRRAPTQPA